MNWKDIAAALRVDPDNFNELNPAEKLLFARARLANLEAEKSAVESAEKALESDVLDALTDGTIEKFRTKNFQLGLSSCPLCGDYGNPEPIIVPAATVYKSRQLWARVGELTPQNAMTLIHHGLAVLIKQTVNTQTISKWLREQVEKDPLYTLPADLGAIVKVNETYDVRSRKA